MGSFRIGAFLLLTILIGVVAAVACYVGLSAGLSDAAVAAGATVVTAAAILPLAIIVGGFFLLLFLGFLARVIANPRGTWRTATGAVAGVLATLRASSSGSDLGLAIARDLMAAQGGDIEPTSAPARGTREQVRFPLVEDS